MRIKKVSETTPIIANVVGAKNNSPIDAYSCSFLNDSIVESGSNANGTYIKYGNGIMICTKSVSSPVSMTSSWNTMYEGSQDLGDFPQEFYSIPQVFYTNHSGGGAIPESFATLPSKTSAGSVWYCRTNSMTVDVQTDVLAIGRWKA